MTPEYNSQQKHMMDTIISLLANGPISQMHLYNLICEDFIPSEIERHYDAALSKLYISNHIKPCFYPGDPPDTDNHSMNGPGNFGYFLSKQEESLIRKGILDYPRTYDLREIARDFEIEIPPESPIHKLIFK